MVIAEYRKMLYKTTSLTNARRRTSADRKEKVTATLTTAVPIAEIFGPRLTGTAEIEGAFRRTGVRYGDWGQGTTKPFTDFLKLLLDNEAWLEDRGDQVPRLHMTSASVTVIHIAEDRYLRLFQASEQFSNGQKMETNPFDGSFGKVLKRGESPLDGAHRAISDKLGRIQPLFNDRSAYKLESQYMDFPLIAMSEDFHPLPATFNRYKITCVIPRQLYVAKGFEVVSNGKTTLYLWQSI